MAPRKRKSNQISTAEPAATNMAPSTPPEGSPSKKRRIGVTQLQKNALIENLQLEVTERARRLRAQYNVQAAQLRSRIEMRVNRIPTALRKLKMGELLAKSEAPQHPPPPMRSPYVAKPPAVPAKDGVEPKPITRKPLSATGRGQKRLSDEISDDKENSVEPSAVPKKRVRGAAATETTRAPQSQVLSPASTNARVNPRALQRPPSPTKAQLARPASPIKSLTTKSSSNLLSSMVEKAKGTRAPVTRNTTASSSASSSAGTAPRTRKPAVPAAPTTATRGRKKVSEMSESSEASTGTVIKKTTARAATTRSAPKKTVMSTIKSATTRKAPAAKTAATPATATTGRALRKRGV